jgi:hypothetical protein
MQNSEIIKMGYVIQEFLKKEKLVDAKPKDLMPILIEKGFFNIDHKEGLPLRKVLRKLDDRDEMYLLPQVRVERKDVNTFWFFNIAKVTLNTDKILSFHKFLNADEFNRYNSWKHCYETFNDVSQEND